MKTLFSFAISLFLMVTFSLSGFGQKNYASNVRTEISDEKMLITYDALANDGTQYFDVVLMITSNGKRVVANSVYGDQGSKITPGSEKSIVWYYTNDFKEDVKKVTVDVYAYKMSEPKAVFRIVSTSNNSFAPCEVKVSNTSDFVNEYKWNFGDPGSGINNQSSEKEPIHVFSNDGIYTITLTARNSITGMENTFYQSIEVKKHDPTKADFRFDVLDSKPPYEVKFQNTSVNADIFLWNFGDPGAGAKNNLSNKPSPQFKYKQSGTYKVELTAKSSVSGLSDVMTKEIVLEAPKNPVVGFVFSLSTDIAPTVAVFKNTSVNATSFSWNFGDPVSGGQNTSNEANPAHTYTKPGKYEVVLTALNSQSKKSIKFSDFVVVNGPPEPPVARFTIENNNGFAPATIIFKNSSSNSNSHQWDFGDPNSGIQNSSNDSLPVHTYYKAGKYTVTLIAKNTKSNLSNQVTAQVVIREVAQVVAASFKSDNNNSLAPATVNFTNTSVNATQYSWDFGDPASGVLNTSKEANPTHIFKKEGKYLVTLVVKNSKGETANFSDYITVTEPVKPLMASFSISNNNSTAPAKVGFTSTSVNATQYSWDFGDPASKVLNTSKENNPTHTFTNAGKYLVTLIVKNSKGETANFSDYITVTEPVKPLLASFSASNNNSTAPAKVGFTSTAVNATQYSWDFGDPASGALNASKENNPSHIYTKGGKYQVTLIVRNSKGETANFSDYITVNEPVKPVMASFKIENNNIAAPAIISFYNTSENGDSYSWDFGDPQSGPLNLSSEKNAKHQYSKPGIYKVTLTVSNKTNDLSKVVFQNATILEPVLQTSADFTYDISGLYAPADVSFSNKSVNADSFKWNFGDPKSGNNESGNMNPVHRYTVPGVYTISLEVKNTKTKEVQKSVKEISILKKYPTFVKTIGKKNSNEISTRILTSANGDYMVLINENETSSTLMTFNSEGKNETEKKINSNLFDIFPLPENKGFVFAGIIKPNDLILQFADRKLNTENPSIVYSNTFDPGCAFTSVHLATAENGERALLGNLKGSYNESNIWFQKILANGQSVATKNKTFRYKGLKIGNRVIPSADESFAITGFWKADENTPKQMMLGIVDKNGVGKINYMSTKEDANGYDLIELPDGNFNILLANQCPDKPEFSQIGFKRVGRNIEALNCEINFTERTKTNDLDKFPPRILKVPTGYVLLSHFFNNTDNDIVLYWINEGGQLLIRKEILKRAGDQYATDIIQDSDGSFIIVGAEKTQDDYNALIIKTDPLGKFVDSPQ